MLPDAFTNRMQKMLKEEYPDFLQSYNETRNQALRLNPLKGDSGRFLDVSSFHLANLFAPYYTLRHGYLSFISFQLVRDSR